MNSVVLKYEDLALNTNRSISYISSAIDTNLDDIESIIGNNKEIFPGHNLGGNRLRFSSEISIKYDQRWEKELGFFYRYIVVLPCFLFVNLFGYSLSSYEKKNRI